MDNERKRKNEGVVEREKEKDEIRKIQAPSSLIL